ncbi:type I-F CRISPR-associated protein Csy3 [Legionella septentrionalis]|uniref:type I-F CRISPR-associated protein Csy3 n=1 Tax=Legionella septentrionalis TaxID=2498109 RepID=UPI000F8EB5EF|nr:type I-F CRISPR-associated protein Csy3 [Legionella septentrionalis]RUQ97050.1 type I-F CRISPR-associated protein Csy3 [Legionella septentrionalis]
MNQEHIKTASVLSFERKLANSDGLLYSGNWTDRHNLAKWKPIPVTEKAIRGTISNRQKNAISNDPAKLDAEIRKPNLQRVDVASLPFDADTLKLSFSLRVLGNLPEPSTCDNPEYLKVLQQVITNYAQTYQFKELAKRYAHNLANGRYLWRNRFEAEKIEVHVTQMLEQRPAKTWVFDAHSVALRNFAYTNPELEELAAVIQKGLQSDAFVFFNIDAYALLGHGQEIFPSQELILDKSNRKGEKSKILYQVNGTAGLHSQKIGNALRTIDTWYADDNSLGPIAIEPFGAVTNRGIAYRQPKEKKDFYTLFDGWVVKNKVPTEDEQHFVIACLIRGGVYGEKSE